MALSTVPFALQNAPHNADLFRQAVSSLVPNSGGIVETGDLAVTQTGTPSMAVQIGTGRAWVKGTEGGDLAGENWGKQALYFALNDAPVTKTIATANSTNPRIDVVYITIKDTAYSGVLDIVDFGVVTGTPAPSPVAPAIPANSTALANVAVAANATSITNANITTPTSLSVIGPYTNGGWQNLTLAGAWVPYSGGGGYYSGLQVRLLPGGMAHIRGMVKNGSAPSTITTLPVGYRPAYTAIKPIVAGTTPSPRTVAYLVFSQDGSVVYDNGIAAPTFVSIDFTFAVA